MGRIYATREDDGKRFLCAIKCDLCGEEIKPYSQINSSGWQLMGTDRGTNSDKLESYYCPQCIAIISIR